MGGTSATGVKAIGKRMFGKLQKKFKKLDAAGKFTSTRHKRVWMKRAARHIAWGQKNSKWVKGKKAGRSGGEQILHALGSSGLLQRSDQLNKAGRGRLKAGKLDLLSGGSGKDMGVLGKGKGGGKDTTSGKGTWRIRPGAEPGSIHVQRKSKRTGRFKSAQ